MLATGSPKGKPGELQKRLKRPRSGSLGLQGKVALIHHKPSRKTLGSGSRRGAVFASSKSRLGMSDQTKHLAGILIFTGQVATAIRMYTAYNQGGTDLEEFAPEDVMFLSDTLVSFEFMGEYLAAGNTAKVINYCDSIAQSLKTYIGQPAFVRNPAVNLQAAITHLVALKSAFAEQLAS
jgi:hypothetical protein